MKTSISMPEKKRVRLYFFSLLLLASHLAIAKGIKYNSQEMAEISIKLSEDISTTGGVTVECILFKDEVNTAMDPDTYSIKEKFGNREVHVRLPLHTVTTYVRLKLLGVAGHGSKNPILKNSGIVFIVEPTDSIAINISKDSVWYEGRGKEKYHCATELAKLNSYSFKESGDLIKQGLYREGLLEAKRKVDSLAAKAMVILEEVRNSVDPFVWTLMDVDSKVRFDMMHFAYLGGTFNHNRKTRFNEIRNIMTNYAFDDYFLKYDQTVLLKSLNFCDFTFMNNMVSARLYNTTPYDEQEDVPYSFRDMVNLLKSRYAGPVLDKMLLIASLWDGNSKYDANLMIDSVKMLLSKEDNIYSKRLKQILDNKSGMAFPFDLPDENGKRYKLEDFKGKLLVIDLWFTGCIGCIGMAKALKPIKGSFRFRNDVAFVTISTDSNREMWKESLTKELYSSESDINLYTDGLGNKHPLIKSYGVNSYPSILVISKEGNIITTSPPLPNRGDEYSKQFKDLLEHHLN